MTRPRRRKNTGNMSGFSVVDPGGNWIRIFPKPGGRDEAASTDQANSRLARTLQNAIVLGESKGDQRQAARILDSALQRPGSSAVVTEFVEALVYRAELALALDDHDRAESLLSQVRDTPLEDTDRARLAEVLATAEDLQRLSRRLIGDAGS